jgi:coenzyme PQQ precursor peptide PqqA
MEPDLPLSNEPLASALGSSNDSQRITIMAWTTPTLVEICVGLEINGYLPAEF